METTMLPPQHCLACGQAIPAARALTDPRFTAVAEPAPGEVLRLAHLAAALSKRFNRTFTTKQAGKLVRSLGLKPKEMHLGRLTGAVSCLPDYRLRV